MKSRLSTPLLFLLGAILCAPVAQAQWKWRDADGQLHYADTPPPMSVPPDRILSSGNRLTGNDRGRNRAATPPTDDPAPAHGSDSAQAGERAPNGGQAEAGSAPSASGDASAGAGAPSVAANGAGAATAGNAKPAPRTPAERLTELRKQQAEKEKAERAEREKQEEARRLAEWCEESRGQARLLESGMRVASVDADGERVIIDDERRQARLTTIRRDLQERCGNT